MSASVSNVCRNDNAETFRAAPLQLKLFEKLEVPMNRKAGRFIVFRRVVVILR